MEKHKLAFRKTAPTHSHTHTSVCTHPDARVNMCLHNALTHKHVYTPPHKHVHRHRHTQTCLHTCTLTHTLTPGCSQLPGWKPLGRS